MFICGCAIPSSVFYHFYDFSFQGRDATDQHIIEVVFKMLQGEKQSLFLP